MTSPKASPQSPAFSALEQQRSFSMSYAVVYAAAAVVAILVSLVVYAMRTPPPPMANAAYASSLSVSGIQMSEADSQTGGKLIYIDGRITNHGSSAVTDVSAEVTFGNDQSLPPQVETAPVNIIYMREPYVDTRRMNAAPLEPGASADFRLIFDDVNERWNQQVPDLKLTQIATR